MFGKRLAEHFSLLLGVFLNCACSARKSSAVALTRMRMPNGFPGPTPHIPPEKGFFDIRAPAPSRQHYGLGNVALTDAFIVSPNGMPAGFRYLIWSRTRSQPGELVRFRLGSRLYTAAQLSIDSVTRTSKSAFLQLALHPGNQG